MIRRHRTLTRIRVARPAMRHLRTRGHPVRLVMALHAIEHFGQSGQRFRMTSGAADLPIQLLPEMRGMRKRDVRVYDRRARSFHARMAHPAVSRLECLCVTSAALLMRRKAAKNSGSIE